MTGLRESTRNGCSPAAEAGVAADRPVARVHRLLLAAHAGGHAQVLLPGPSIVMHRLRSSIRHSVAARAARAHGRKVPGRRADRPYASARRRPALGATSAAVPDRQGDLGRPVRRRHERRPVRSACCAVPTGAGRGTRLTVGRVRPGTAACHPRPGGARLGRRSFMTAGAHREHAAVPRMAHCESLRGADERAVAGGCADGAFRERAPHTGAPLQPAVFLSSLHVWLHWRAVVQRRSTAWTADRDDEFGRESSDPDIQAPDHTVNFHCRDSLPIVRPCHAPYSHGPRAVGGQRAVAAWAEREGLSWQLLLQLIRRVGRRWTGERTSQHC